MNARNMTTDSNGMRTSLICGAIGLSAAIGLFVALIATL